MSVRDFLSGSSNNRSQRSSGDRSHYERDMRDPAPAKEVRGVSLQSVNLVETGTYNQEFLRPYMVSATDQTLNEIADTVESLGGAVTAANISGISGRMMSYSNRVSDRDLIDIEGGWDERRFSFIIEVIERQRDEDERETGREVVTFLAGYTDCLDIADLRQSRNRARTNNELVLSPETVLFVSNLRRIERDTRRIVTNNQLIVPSYYRNQAYRRDRKDLFTIRPRDVLNNESIMNGMHSRRDDVPVINGTINLNGNMIKPSRASNLNPSTYLSSTINALIRSETVAASAKDLFGNYTSNNSSRGDVYNRAQSFTREDTAYEANSFLTLIREETRFSNDQTFTWGELQKLFGYDDLENLTEVHTFDRVQRDSRVAEHNDTARWDENENSGQNAVIATMLKQTLPSYAMESLIYACRIEATNMLRREEQNDAVDGIKVVVSDVVFAARFDERTQDDLIRDLEDNIALDILKDASLNNSLEFDIVVDLDWRFDSFYHVAVDGGRMFTFSSGGFSSSLTSPIITANADTVEDIGRDLRSIVTSALGR